MRDMETLRAFKQAMMVQRFLYAYPEEKITVRNAIGGQLELFMDDDGMVMSRLAGATDAFPYDGNLDHQAWMGILEQLAGQPARIATEGSRLDEIIALSAAITIMNPPSKRRTA